MHLATWFFKEFYYCLVFPNPNQWILLFLGFTKLDLHWTTEPWIIGDNYEQSWILITFFLVRQYVASLITAIDTKLNKTVVHIKCPIKFIHSYTKGSSRLFKYPKIIAINWTEHPLLEINSNILWWTSMIFIANLSMLTCIIYTHR